MSKEVTLEEVSAFCARRVVDLVMCPGRAPSTLALHGEFDGYGDFFTLLFADVEYVDLPGQLSLGGLLPLDDVGGVHRYARRWSWLERQVSGPAIVVHGGYVSGWDEPMPAEYGIVVANTITAHAGADWDRVMGTAPSAGGGEAARRGGFPE